MSRIQEIAALVRMGLATRADLAELKPEDAYRIRCDREHTHRRFYAEKAFGVERGKRIVRGVVHSTEDVDRMGDRISVKGWKLDNYRKNPQLLWAHDSGGGLFGGVPGLPIGNALKTRRGQSATGKRALLIDERYHEEELNPRSELIWRMVAAGALPARSVGFLPIKVDRPKDDEEREKWGLGKGGHYFREQELLESSVVPVPANVQALQENAVRAFKSVLAESGDLPREVIVDFEKNFPLTEEHWHRLVREVRRSVCAMQGFATGGIVDRPVPCIAGGSAIPIDIENGNVLPKEVCDDIAKAVRASQDHTGESEAVEPDPECGETAAEVVSNLMTNDPPESGDGNVPGGNFTMTVGDVSTHGLPILQDFQVCTYTDEITARVAATQAMREVAEEMTKLADTMRAIAKAQNASLEILQDTLEHLATPDRAEGTDEPSPLNADSREANPVSFYEKVDADRVAREVSDAIHPRPSVDQEK